MCHFSHLKSASTRAKGIICFTCPYTKFRPAYSSCVTRPPSLSPLSQPDMYSRVPQGYPDSMPHPSMGGYPGPPNYGPSPQYPGQYPYGSPSSIPTARMPPGAMAPTMDGYPDSMRSSQSASASSMVYPGAGPWPTDPSRRVAPPGMSRAWSQVKSCNCMW